MCYERNEHHLPDGGADLDDTVKVHVRNVKLEDGQIVKMAFVMYSPWSWVNYIVE